MERELRRSFGVWGRIEHIRIIPRQAGMPSLSPLAHLGPWGSGCGWGWADIHGSQLCRNGLCTDCACVALETTSCPFAM